MKLWLSFHFFLYLMLFCGSFGKPSQPAHKPCKKGFLLSGKFCYKFNGLPQLPFARAAFICTRLGARLADVSVSPQRDNVIGLLKSHGYHEQDYWISLHSRNTSFTFRTTLVQAHICTVIYRHPAYDIRIAACNRPHLFVCQHPARSRAKPRSQGRNSTCEGKYGYFSHPEDCTRYFLCLNGNRHDFQCHSGKVFEDSVKRCLTDAVCSNNTQPSVGTEEHNTEDELSEEEDVEIEENGSTYVCEHGYKRHRSKCYKVLHSAVGWERASQTCADTEGALLATIPSRTFTTFFRKLLKSSVQDFWIGLNDREVSERYVWNNDSLWEEDHYSNWSRRARKRFKERKQCVKLSAALSFQWLDENCSEENGFICEKDATRRFKDPSSLCGQFRMTGRPRTQAVIGGTHAEGKTHPWQVSLRYEGDHQCGASLIDRCWVLTAAHCVSFLSADFGIAPNEAVLGDFNLVIEEEDEERLRIERIFVHPEWESYPIPNNDIALIKLGRCSRKHNPICLPSSQDFAFPPNTECNIAGYGTINEKRKVYPEKLMEAAVPLIDFETCQSLYRTRGRRRRTQITESMFCAGYLEGGIDACQGDSGGPLTCHDMSVNRETQWGIVSWGNGCARANKPGVYTKVSYFREWIRNVTYINF